MSFLQQLTFVVKLSNYSITLKINNSYLFSMFGYLYGSRGIMISGDLNSNLIPAMKKTNECSCAHIRIGIKSVLMLTSNFDFAI